MRAMPKWFIPAAVLLAATVMPAAAQPYGYGYGYGYDDGPPAFRRGIDWDGPPRWGWQHHRRWRDEGGFERRGWRDEGRDDGQRRFGGDNRRRFGNDEDAGGRGGGRFRNGQPGRDVSNDAMQLGRDPNQRWYRQDTD